ncbi:MAG: SusC/RagA family TonB-linked outer membrane protein [Tidjanibacter sp.]|nr:SusC/RagA family TonB-linked outer membrane protein [Tidjanibacter sp.]
MLKQLLGFRKALLSVAVLIMATSAVFAQKVTTVSGTVKNAEGEAIIGATIVEVETNVVTISGVDGSYSIKVNPNSTLWVSYVGYTDVYEPVAGRTNITFTLEQSAEQIEEIVMVGYGSQKKKEVTGSVASIKSEDFNQGVKTNPIGLLQGKVAGLNIIKTSSDPTSTGYSMQIRGFSTLDKGAGTSPLFIVDGVPVSNIDNISNDEIASMDVLKDGSAAAIYGTRGTNGVIIITTKRGENFSKEAQTMVEYSGYMSASVRNGDMGMATPEEFVKLEETTGGLIKPTLIKNENGEYELTDWMDALTRDVAMTQHHNVAISGSASNFNYRASVAYKDAQGIAQTSNRNELMAKIAASQKALNGRLELQYDLSYMQYRNDYFTGDFKQAAILNPTYPIYDETQENGFYLPQGTGLTNPVENMTNKESYQDGNFFRGSVKASLRLFDGLKLSAFAAMEDGDNASYWYNGVINTDIEGSGKAGRSTDSSRNELYEATLDYAWSSGSHSVTAVAGVSYQHFLYDGMNASNKGFPTPGMKYYQIGNGDAEKTYLNVGSYRNSNTLAAAFGRVNYSFDGKYLVSASIRREGSSRFGANNKWGWFPALSFGWRINEEEFMMGNDQINDLKLRLGWGVTGNNLASDLRSVAMLSNGGTFWYNGAYVYTYGVSQNVNPDLRWEKKHEYNLGLDYAISDNRFYGSLDVYYRQTRDLLWDYEVPTPPYQYPTLLANAGQMDSFGVELVLNAEVIRGRDFSWTTTPTISFNRNYLTKLSDPSKGFNYKETTSGGVGENGIMNTNTQILIEGESVGAFYGLKFYQIDETGRWIYRTPAGGYCDDATAVDAYRQVIGNAQPLFTFGWNNSFRYKNFDATIFFRGVYGNDVLNLTRWAYGPRPTQADNLFMKDVNGTNVTYTNKANFSDYYLEDGSYIKLDNVTIGYTHRLPNDAAVKSLRVYVTAQNLLTITKYSGLDPEVDTNSVWSAGIDYCDFYPTVATVLFGLNLSFN